MSTKCNYCGLYIRRLFTRTTPTEIRDDSGRTYRFCSEACAKLWTARRDASPRRSPRVTAARSEEDKQVDQRWLSEGGAMGPAV